MGHKQSRLFLDCIDDNFLTQVIEELTRGGTLLGLVLTKKEELVKDVKVRGNLDCSDHEMVEIRILSGGNKAKSRTTTLVFRRKKLRVKQVAQRGCGVSVFGDVQNPTGHNPEQPASADAVLNKGDWTR